MAAIEVEDLEGMVATLRGAGALFRNDDNTTTRTELLVLIAPRIISSSNDARAATEDLERRMHAVRPIVPLAR